MCLMFKYLSGIIYIQMDMNDNRRRTVREMKEMLDISKAIIHLLLFENFRMQRVWGRWVPRLLKEEKQRRVLCFREFLCLVGSGRENFLDLFMMTDKNWLHYYDPEGKWESSVSKTPGTLPSNKKAQVSKSVRKSMFIKLMDRHDMILTYTVPAGQTVISPKTVRFYKRLILAVNKET